MKAVYKKNHEKILEFCFKWIATYFIYLLIMVAYVFINILIHDNLNDTITFKKILYEGWHIFFIFISPIIVSSLHFLHKEKGWLFCKFGLWMLIALFVLLVPLLIVGFSI